MEAAVESMISSAPDDTEEGSQADGSDGMTARDGMGPCNFGCRDTDSERFEGRMGLDQDSLQGNDLSAAVYGRGGDTSNGCGCSLPQCGCHDSHVLDHGPVMPARAQSYPPLAVALDSPGTESAHVTVSDSDAMLSQSLLSCEMGGWPGAVDLSDTAAASCKMGQARCPSSTDVSGLGPGCKFGGRSSLACSHSSEDSWVQQARDQREPGPVQGQQAPTAVHSFSRCFDGDREIHMIQRESPPGNRISSSWLAMPSLCQWNDGC